MSTLFYEPSTRTRLSFERRAHTAGCWTAAQRRGPGQPLASPASPGTATAKRHLPAGLGPFNSSRRSPPLPSTLHRCPQRHGAPGRHHPHHRVGGRVLLGGQGRDAGGCAQENSQPAILLHSGPCWVVLPGERCRNPCAWLAPPLPEMHTASLAPGCARRPHRCPADLPSPPLVRRHDPHGGGLRRCGGAAPLPGGRGCALLGAGQQASQALALHTWVVSPPQAPAMMLLLHPSPCSHSLCPLHHSWQAGSAERAAKAASIPIINAGDGPGQHPTQVGWRAIFDRPARGWSWRNVS